MEKAPILRQVAIKCVPAHRVRDRSDMENRSIPVDSIEMVADSFERGIDR